MNDALCVLPVCCSCRFSRCDSDDVHDDRRRPHFVSKRMAVARLAFRALTLAKAPRVSYSDATAFAQSAADSVCAEHAQPAITRAETAAVRPECLNPVIVIAPESVERPGLLITR